MISTNTAQLHDAISRARLVAGRNSANEMFQMALLSARTEDAWLTITATSPDSQIALDVDADVEVPISICVDAERLALAVAVPGERSKLTIDGERLKITTGRSVFRLPTRPAADFPMLPSQGDKIASFECPWLSADLKRVLPFTGSSDHVRVDFRGVSFKGSEGVLRIDGTTGSKCATAVRDIADKSNFSFMLPRRSCEILVALEPTRAIFKNGTALFLAENMQYVTVYLQAQLADTAKVYPRVDAPIIVVDRKEFVDAVKSVAAVSDVILKRQRPVKLTVTDGTLAIEALGQSAEGRAEIAAEGSNWSGCFDAELLTDLSESADEEKLRLFVAPSPERTAVMDGLFMAVGTGTRA